MRVQKEANRSAKKDSREEPHRSSIETQEEAYIEPMRDANKLPQNLNPK